MSDTEQVVGIGTASSLIEQLGKAIFELRAQKNDSEDQVQWTEIEQHFHSLETKLKEKSEELEAKEKEFEANRALFQEREAAVAAKEQEYLDRVQELKDAAVAAIDETRAKYKPSEPVDGGEHQESKVSSSLGDTYALNSASEEKSPDENAEGCEAVEVKPRPELTQFCEQMDAKGLVVFTLENQTNLSAIRDEFSVALESAAEPARLVLDSLEGFYPSDESTQPEDAALQGKRKSCIMFLGALGAFLARADPGADHLLSPEIKQQAKAIADEWKPKLAGTASLNSMEAEAFLQLLATFKIPSEFDDEELCKLVLAVASNRRAPQLCRSLELTHKMPGVIDMLIQNGKQIEAVHFIQAFALAESFPPVPLLKTYLKDLRRNSQGKGGGGQNDANAQELAALKVVIKCVEEYNLIDEYPLDPLQKRVAQLEKSKADKKRFGDFGKPQQQSKKPRANGGGFFGTSRARVRPVTPAVSAINRQVPPVYSERAATYNPTMLERYSHAVVPSSYDYPVSSQSTYDQRSYYYPQDDRVTPTSYGAGAAAATPNYGSYVSGGLPSSHQPYNM